MNWLIDGRGIARLALPYCTVLDLHFSGEHAAVSCFYEPGYHIHLLYAFAVFPRREDDIGGVERCLLSYLLTYLPDMKEIVLAYGMV